ncbi:MAG: damage-inducible protein DinB [Bauldia sp.]|nr:damage-inducible protein DinB [Bauldia sp.]
MKAHFAMFADYNRWANRRLYAAARALPDADYRADRGAFFGSLHRTLNHLVVTDRIWMHRFTGEGPVQTRLDEVLFDALDALEEARRAEDERIIAYIGGLDDAAIAATFTYRTISNPRDITQPLAPALAHFFNHQTHHRGQAHCLVTESAGNDAMPSLDLLAFQRETGVGLG